MAKYIDEKGLIKIFSLLKENYYNKIETEALMNGITEVFGDGEIGQVLTKTEDSVKWADNNLQTWKGTLEEYNAITEKDDDTIYFVIGEINVEDSTN